MSNIRKIFAIFKYHGDRHGYIFNNNGCRRVFFLFLILQVSKKDFKENSLNVGLVTVTDVLHIFMIKL